MSVSKDSQLRLPNGSDLLVPGAGHLIDAGPAYVTASSGISGQLGGLLEVAEVDDDAVAVQLGIHQVGDAPTDEPEERAPSSNPLISTTAPVADRVWAVEIDRRGESSF
jgi:hypothetical protein